MRRQDFLQRQKEFRLEFHQEQRSGQRSRWQRELKMQGRIFFYSSITWISRKSKSIESTKFLEASNSSSVSPGKPTITSVVNAGFSKYFLRIPQRSAYSSLVYLRFIRFNVALQPLCSERWKCGHIFGNFEIASANSSVIIPGSSEPSRILSIPSI